MQFSSTCPGKVQDTVQVMKHKRHNIIRLHIVCYNQLTKRWSNKSFGWHLLGHVSDHVLKDRARKKEALPQEVK